MGKILITGGGLFHNNGAQAMTFVAVSELKRRFPDSAICHLRRGDYLRPPEEKAPFAFEICDKYSRRMLCHLAGWPFRAVALRGGIDRKRLAAMDALLKDADMIVDVSGFGFGSQWGMTKSIMLPLLARTAKRYHIKLYLMPQSFGPIDFPGLKGRLFNWFAARCFAKAELIFAREQSGYDALTKRYRLQNVRRSADMVLQNSGIDPASVYVHPAAPRALGQLGESPVALFPAKKTFTHGKPKELLGLYRALIERLLGQGHSVYLMHHAPQDRVYCTMIHALFAGDARVSLIDEDFTSLDFENLLPGFEFVVSSRFHCVVHAYKHGVPCVVLGWADKYAELLTLFDQQAYAFNVCEEIEEQKILYALDRMNGRRETESETILTRLKDVQKGNVFDALGPVVNEEPDARRARDENEVE